MRAINASYISPNRLEMIEILVENMMVLFNYELIYHQNSELYAYDIRSFAILRVKWPNCFWLVMCFFNKWLIILENN